MFVVSPSVRPSEGTDIEIVPRNGVLCFQTYSKICLPSRQGLLCVVRWYSSGILTGRIDSVSRYTDVSSLGLAAGVVALFAQKQRLTII